MSRRRSGWRPIPGTPAHRAYRRVDRDGVAVLCVRLAGWADNNPDGVSRVKDGLDELAAAIPEELDVATLDVRGFCNASDDACAILTAVFAGLPCCWITGQWDQQHEGQRWDLPASGRMAPNGEAALARVVGWRRAGGFSIDHGGGCSERSQWTERGLLVSTTRGGVPDVDDLWSRNRLVERVLHGERARRVLWPVADRSGVTHEAERRGARLVIAGDQIVEVDFTLWSTGRPLPEDWVARIAGLDACRELDLRTTAASEVDIVRAVQALPALVALRAPPGALGPDALAQLRRERPALAVR